MYTTEGGQQAHWRPATRSGRYMSAEQYEQQGRAATDREMAKLLASPEYQKWMMKNHGRVKVVDDDDAALRQPEFSDDD